MDKVELLDCIRNKINQMEIEESPFPHGMIDNFLPEEFFKELMSSFPDEAFERGKFSSKARQIIENDTPAFEECMVSSSWKTLREVVNSAEHQQLMLGHYWDHIKKNGGTIERSDLFSTKFDISRANVGYQRSVHLDRRTHVVNSFIYLNTTEAYKGEGGDLLLHDYTGPDEIFDVFPPQEVTPVAKVIPTGGNRFVSFLATSRSYHSVVPITKSNGYRKFVYIATDARGIEDAWPTTTIYSQDRRLAFINQ
jgi:hypothetical protein